MKKNSRWLFWFLIFTSFISLCCYCSVLVSPSFFWPAALFSYAIPFVLILNLLITLFLLAFKWRVAIFPVIILIAGFPFFNITYSVHHNRTINNEYFTVLSFNAKFFRKKGVYNEFSTDLIEWAANDTSDIKCFQEYSTNHRWEALDVTKQIQDGGYESFIFKADIQGKNHSPGLAIFSKYTILDSGYVWHEIESIYAGIYVDVEYNEDTLRIYNVHLTSMQLTKETSPSNSFLQDIREVITKFKYGNQKRTKQIDKLIEHTRESPYPFILCGDFNDVPYSYNYFRMKQYVSNSFEETGNGFGLTYIRKLLFLRIDHQFHNNKIESLDFSVDSEIDISDHFPTRGSYRPTK